jgi:hypothetical protein
MVGGTFKTLGQVSQFTLSGIDPRSVRLVLKTGQNRAILRASFESAWKRIQAGKELTREEMDLIEARQGTYMAAILRHMPDIQWFDQPVRLGLRPAPKAKPQHQRSTAGRPVPSGTRLATGHQRRSATPLLSARPAQSPFLASRGRPKYHRPECKWAAAISKASLLHFASANQAGASGYKPCRTCCREHPLRADLRDGRPVIIEQNHGKGRRTHERTRPDLEALPAEKPQGPGVINWNEVAAGLARL